MKNEDKIRTWLGDRYHLNTEITFKEDKTIIEKWKLFKVYEGWMTDNSDAIMTNETHTEEELFKFAKEHRKYDLNIVGSKAMSIVAFLNLILVFLNIWFRTNFIDGFVWGVDFTILVVCLVKMIYLKKNEKVEEKEFREKIEAIFKRENIKDERENNNRKSN